MDPARKSRSFRPLLAFTFVVAAALTLGAVVAYEQIKSGNEEQSQRRSENSKRIGEEVQRTYKEQMARRLKGYAASAAAGISASSVRDIHSERDELAIVFKRRMQEL